MMFEQHEDHRPVMWLAGYPLYATHCLVLGYLITMVVVVVLGPQALHGLFAACRFDSELVHGGQIWRIVTYGLFNPPSIPFAVDMVMLFWFGRELERFFGRKIFLSFYSAVYLLPPVLFTLFGFVRPLQLFGEPGSFACFIAFATLYPGALLLFGIAAAWWAIGAVSIYALMFLFARQGIQLAELLITVGFAFAFVRYQQGRFSLPSVRIPSLGRKPKFRVVPKPSVEDLEDEIDEPMAEVDALLDKIAKSGIASLTAKERARLEKAREDLMKRESPRR